MHGGSQFHQLWLEQEGGFYQVWLKGWILSGLANTHKGWILSGNRTELYIVRFESSLNADNSLFQGCVKTSKNSLKTTLSPL